MDDPFLEGKSAYIDGWDRSDNPNEEGSYEFEQWELGWEEAKHEAGDESGGGVL